MTDFPTRAELEEIVNRRPDGVTYNHPLGTRVERRGIDALLAVARWALDLPRAKPQPIDLGCIETDTYRHGYQAAERRLLPPFREEDAP